MGVSAPTGSPNGGSPADPDYQTLGTGTLRPSTVGREAADRLQSILENAESWPIWQASRVGGVDTGTYSQVGKYGKSMRDLALYVAMRENDREQIIKLTHWENDRVIHLDPLPERIAAAYSDLLYGEAPDFIAGDPNDQENLDDLIENTALADELKRWVDMAVSEGEVWWRAWTDLDASEWPLIENHSRMDVTPLFVGRKLVAAAFVDTIQTKSIQVENRVEVQFWRHVEIHAVGYVRNLLFVGTTGTLGREVKLTDAPDTYDLERDWEHDLPLMLAGRIPNKLGRDFTLGVSEFSGVRDMILDLYEARTIMAENARLVLKARMLVPAESLDKEGNFDAGKDVIPIEVQDEELGGNKGGPYTVLEYNFQSKELVEHKTELTLDILARVGLAEQFVQETRGGAGQAFTGTALRTRLIPTLQSASGKARNFDKEVPNVGSALIQLSALDRLQGGCGQSWTNPKAKPVQKRSSLLPEDQNEEVQRHVMAVQGEVESIQTAVEQMHGEDWDEERIELEVALIRGDHTVGPTFAEEGDTAEDVERDSQPADPPIPNVPPGGPGSKVATPSDVLGSEQPGAGRRPDGQSPGKTPPQVKAGGPK